jgi:hypothetical protein
MTFKSLTYIFLLVIFTVSLSARSFRVSQIPNGNKFSCQTCHVSPAGGDERNAFGKLVEKRFLTSLTGNVIWGPELASLDADGDGVTNGQELLDPFGIWTSGSPNPGNSSSVTAPGNNADYSIFNLTIFFTNMNPHNGQMLYLRIYEKSTLKEVYRTSQTITESFNVIVNNFITWDNEYIVDFFADHNGNGLYDAPPTDHAWRMELNTSSFNQLSFSHNTEFTDIKWPYTFILNLNSMNPHVGQLIEFALVEEESDKEIDRYRIEQLASDNTFAKFVGLEIGKNYKVIFYADHNGNGMYDAPPADHAWELSFTYSNGLEENFTHNTSFTDINWKYYAQLNLLSMLPHLNQLFEIRLVESNSNSEISRFSLENILVENYSIKLPGLEDGVNYNLDFYSDHNGSGSYDAPPTDHAWRISFTADGNYVSNFSHNTSFTDIQWPGATSVDDLIVPDKLMLSQNYPNPFNPTTSIEYSVPNSEFVILKVYDILGNEVATLVNDFIQAGTHRITFNAADLASGIYVYKIVYGNKSLVNKMLLLK